MAALRVRRTPGARRALGAARTLRRALADRRAPLVLLAAILALSFAARVLHIDQPCRAPCATPGEHTLIFDEAYYVSAARAIAGIAQSHSAKYYGAPKGEDPNAEHAQLAKLVIAGGIELLGDGPWGWRLPSVLFGLLAMAALYALVTGAGASRRLAVGAVAVMALDNLMLVHSRIATLDIYAVALMLVAGALYVRRRPWLAGAALGVGGCMKLVALYLLVALVLYEGLGLLAARGRAPTGGPGALTGGPRAATRGSGLRAALAPLAACGLASVLVYLGLLWALDLLVPAWDPGSRRVLGASPFSHFAHIVDVARALRIKPHSGGISSTPWQWLIDQRPIHYARVAVDELARGKVVGTRAAIDFQGRMNPAIVFSALPALAVGLVSALRTGDRVAMIAVAWTLGTFLPFVLQYELADRVSYIFYMLIVMPGVYVLAARLFSARLMPRVATVAWAALLLYGFVHLYPLRMALG
ncbi:MAG: glycosyltransferase family 39 protein [Solirubrobacteraceae bacterium]